MTKGSSRSHKLASDAQPKRLGVSPGLVPEASEAPNEALALEAAQYIAQMSAELASIARASKLDLLAYFLEMARVEATSSVRKLEGRPD